MQKDFCLKRPEWKQQTIDHYCEPEEGKEEERREIGRRTITEIGTTTKTKEDMERKEQDKTKTKIETKNAITTTENTNKKEIKRIKNRSSKTKSRADIIRVVTHKIKE